MSASADLIVAGVSFILTLMVLSYLIGDNPLFRIAIYIFVGVSAGYAATIAWYQVLWPSLFRPLIFGNPTERIFVIIPLLLSLLLLMKLSPRTGFLGSVSMAFLVGTGAAVAVGGAIMGTIIPQTQASIKIFDLTSNNTWIEAVTEGAIMIVGTITTLIYFHFGAKPSPSGPQRNKFISTLSWIGQIFIAITFGVLFAGILTAALTAFIERIAFLWSFISSLG